MSKFSEEKKFLIQNKANYKMALCISDFSSLNLQNIVYAEDKMDASSEKMTCSTVNGLVRFAKNIESIDLIETGEIKIRNCQELKKLLELGNVICELELTSAFLGLKWKFSKFFSLSKRVQYLSTILEKDILYYVKGKKICCFIR